MKQLCRLIDERGVLWTALYSFRRIVLGFNRWTKFQWVRYILRILESRLIILEKRKFLTGDHTISSLYHTVEQNKKIWNSYNWLCGGEEWTEDAYKYRKIDPNLWKTSLINEMIFKYIEKGTMILEIGPGAGRWTEILLKLADRLILADITEKCLDICQKKFSINSNIKYCLIQNQGLGDIESSSVDYIWSYDVFVHINPTDTERYVRDFQRILKAGALGIIHHAGTYMDEKEEDVRNKKLRSYIDGAFFAYLINRNGMEMVEQNNSLVHCAGDLISVFRKPKVIM